MHSVSYQLALEDYDAFWLHHTKKQSGSVWWIVRYGFPTLCVVIFLGLLVSAFMTGKWGDVASPMGLFWGCLALQGIFWMNISRYFRHRKLRKTVGFGAVILMNLNEEVVEVHHAKGESKFPWRHILRIDELKDYLLIFLNARVALIVPKRSFESEEAMHHFVIYAREQWQTAHPVPQAPPIAMP